MPDPSPSEQPKPISNAASLFDTDEVRQIQVTPAPAPAPEPAAPVDGYDLDGFSYPEVEEPPRPVVIPPPPVDRPRVRSGSSSGSKPKASPVAEESGSSEFVTEVSEVDPVWTRSAEWGSDLVRVAVVGLGTLFLAWLTIGMSFTLCFLVLVVGGAATVLLGYPILITLERPVRITPEHAVTDFYEAASHHFPHYRRMWLLLSVLGRESSGFDGFEEFRDYWKGRIERWKAVKGVGKYVPLKLEVESFRSDKSTGKETSRADYTVNVYARGREAEGPIESIKTVHGLVKGPDRMWYMNRGVLDSGAR